MTRRLATVARLAVPALAVTALTACGTGLDAHTYEQTGRGDSVSAELDQLVVRNLQIQAPQVGNQLAAGTNALLTGSLVNRGTSPDQLTSVTSEAAEQVELLVDDAPVTVVEIPAGGAAGTWSARLSGLKAAVHGGQYLPVTLTFAAGGRTTVRVPVQIGDGGLEVREENQNPYGHG